MQVMRVQTTLSSINRTPRWAFHLVLELVGFATREQVTPVLLQMLLGDAKATCDQLRARVNEHYSV